MKQSYKFKKSDLKLEEKIRFINIYRSRELKF